jgi:hypothetical protein
LQILSVFFLTYFVLCTVALTLPKIPKGKYPLGSKQVKLWFFGFCFKKIWGHPLINRTIFVSTFLRTLFLKCLGCQISLTSMLSSDVTLYDPHLIKIGKGCTVGMKVTICPHMVAGGKLILGEIVLEDFSFVSLGGELFVDSYLGKGARLDPKVTLFEATVPENARIKSYSIVDKSMNLSKGEKVPPMTNPLNYKK